MYLKINSSISKGCTNEKSDLGPFDSSINIENVLMNCKQTADRIKKLSSPQQMDISTKSK